MREGWEVKKLGDVCDFQNGFAFKSKTFKDSGTPIVRITNIKDKIIDISKVVHIHEKDYEQDLSKYKIEKNDLLIAMSGATTGKIGIYLGSQELLLNQRVGKFKPKNLLNKQYLFYYLSMNVEKNLEISVGSAQPNLSTEQIKNFELPLPSVSEQTKIVKTLDSAFAQIDQAKANLEKNLANAKELFASKLNEVFSQRGEGWVEKRLGDVCKYDKKKYINNNLPYIGLENIESNTGKFIGSLEPINVKSSTFYFSSEHLLYGRLRPYLNKVLMPNFEGHCSTEIFPIKIGDETLREFLFYWFISDATVKKIDATWTGARMPRANMKEVINFKLTLPIVSKQIEIVDTLNMIYTQINNLQTHYQQKLNNLEELKKSILEKAFRGEL